MISLNKDELSKLVRLRSKLFVEKDYQRMIEVLADEFSIDKNRIHKEDYSFDTLLTDEVRAWAVSAGVRGVTFKTPEPYVVTGGSKGQELVASYRVSDLQENWLYDYNGSDFVLVANREVLSGPCCRCGTKGNEPCQYFFAAVSRDALRGVEI